MTYELIERFVEADERNGKPVSIAFRKRQSIKGLFIQGRDYQELKVKNFWRIVSEMNLEEWKKTGDESLARLFSGGDFLKLSNA